MIKKVKICNFQGIGEEVQIPLSKLNLFFGPNAAGKSSISRALRLFGDYVNSNYPLQNSMSFAEIFKNGEIGEFENYVHNHDASNTITIEWELGIELKVPGLWHEDKFPNWQKLIEKAKKEHLLFHLRSAPQSSIHFAPDGNPVFVPMAKDETQAFEINATVKLELSTPGIVTGFTISTNPFLVPNLEMQFPALSLSMATQGQYPEQVWDLEAGTKLQYPIYVAIMNEMLSLTPGEDGISQFAELKNKTIRAAIDSHTVKYDEGGLSWYFSSNDSGKWQSHGVVYNEFENWQHKIYSVLSEQLKMSLVGPLRAIPGAVLMDDDEVFGFQPEPVASEDLGFNLARNWFKKLTNGFDFEVSKLSANGLSTNYLKLDLITPSGVRINFKDAGVGLGQILPVLTNLFPQDFARLKKRGSQLWIEQPEIHLHPKMQGELADAFIQHCNDYHFTSQLFVETHSENIVLRLLRRLRETNFGVGDVKVYPEDVSVLFVSHDGSQTQIQEMHVLSSGEILENWPLDFVEIRMDDLLS
jgi:predicted ATPase